MQCRFKTSMPEMMLVTPGLRGKPLACRAVNVAVTVCDSQFWVLRGSYLVDGAQRKGTELSASCCSAVILIDVDNQACQGSWEPGGR